MLYKNKKRFSFGRISKNFIKESILNILVPFSEMISLSLQTGFLSGKLLYFINLVIVTLIVLICNCLFFHHYLR